MSILKKIILSFVAVPLIGMTVLVTQPMVLGGSEAAAQYSIGKAPSNNEPRSDRALKSGGGSEAKAYVPGIPPCPPGTKPTPNCKPWTPPLVSSSKEDCKCQIKRINGVSVKDCMVLVNNFVQYCQNKRVVRRD